MHNLHYTVINCILSINRAFFIFPLFFHLKDPSLLHLVSRQHLSTHLPTHLSQQSLKIISKSLSPITVSNQCFTCVKMFEGPNEKDCHMKGTLFLLLVKRLCYFIYFIHWVSACYYIILFLSELSFAYKGDLSYSTIIKVVLSYFKQFSQIAMIKTLVWIKAWGKMEGWPILNSVWEATGWLNHLK